jgi:hypothetical protein
LQQPIDQNLLFYFGQLLDFCFCRRFEIFHGHNTENVTWEAQSRNPRQPNSLSFENVKFCTSELPSVSELDNLSTCIGDLAQRICAKAASPLSTSDAALQEAKSADASNLQLQMDVDKEQASVPVSSLVDAKKLQAPLNVEDTKNQPTDAIDSSREMTVVVSKQQASDYASVVHLMSPTRTGVLDEVMIFTKMGILEISPSGVPRLSEDWFSKVDIILLEDMDSACGSQTDPDGKYCVHKALQQGLEKHWERHSYGWALTADPDDLIFDFDELDEWRKTFEGKVEEEANISEGIGRFGL